MFLTLGNRLLVLDNLDSNAQKVDASMNPPLYVARAQSRPPDASFSPKDPSGETGRW